MSLVVMPWAGTPDERRSVESRLRGMVGRSLRRVNYLDPDTSDPWRIKAHPGLDAASMGVELHWKAGDTEVKWMMEGEREGLAVVFDQTPADLSKDRTKSAGLPEQTRWRRAYGAVIMAVGVSWHQPTADLAAIWAVRLEFSSGQSIVVALGEWRDGTLQYVPDQLVVVFDAAIARSYVVPTGEEPAWGHNIPTAPDQGGTAARPELHGLYHAAVQVEIVGNLPGLLTFAEALESGQQKRINLTEPIDIAHWDGWLTEVEVQPIEGGRVKVDRNASKLLFTGDPSGLAILAANVRGLTAGEVGPHIHEEYYSGHPFFDETTLPMVVTLIE